ncbi:MAG: hypothetical protein ACOYB2_10390 [Limnohabitans sp.]
MAEKKFRRPACQAPAYGFRIGSQCGRPAVWTIGSDGFGAKRGKKVCDDWTCRSWGSGGYPVSMRRIESPSETKARLLAEQNA